MRTSKVLEFKIDNFLLKALVSGNGPTVIVLGSHKYYPRTFSDNLTKHLKLIYTDTRGFTPNHPSHVKSDFIFDKIVHDIEVIRASLSADKIILIGHSIHALIVLGYANHFPSKVSHLVLIASSPLVGHKTYKEADRYFEESVCPERKTAFESSMQNFIENDSQSFVRRMLAFGPKLWYDYKFDASKLWDNVEVNSIGSEVIWGSMFVNYNVVQALSAIKCPIFLALGRYDYFNPPHLWEAYRDYASNLTVRIFEKSSHTPQFEESENFDIELIKWLKI